MFISGIMMAGLLSALNSFSSTQKSQNDDIKMINISSSISKFFAMNDRIPCPADPSLLPSDADYGKEKLDPVTRICDYKFAKYENNGTIQSNLIDAGFQNHTLSLRKDATSNFINTPHKIVFGTIPFKTLNIQESYMYDIYNNKFTYVVISGYATDRKNSTNDIYKRISGWARISLPSKMRRLSPNESCDSNIVSESTTSTNDSKCTERISSSCLSSTNTNPLKIITLLADGLFYTYNNDGKIGVYAGDAIISPCRMDIKSYSGNYITRENLTYTIINHGKNGYGSWKKDGKINSISEASENEKKNTFAFYNESFSDHNLLNGNRSIEFVNDSMKIDFDDKILYTTTEDLLAQAGRLKDVYCHMSTVMLDFASILSNPPTTTELKKEPNCYIWNLSMKKDNDTKDIKITTQTNTTCGTNNSILIDCSAGGMWTNLH